MRGASVIAAVVGAMAGAGVDEGAGAVFGAVLGFLLSAVVGLRKRLAAVELQEERLNKDASSTRVYFELELRKLREELVALRGADAAAAVERDAAIAPSASGGEPTPPASRAVPQATGPAAGGPSPPEPREKVSRPLASAPRPTGTGAQRAGAASPATSPQAAAPVAARIASQPLGPLPPDDWAAANDPFAKGFEFLRELLFGGNTVVRAGILVLLVGLTLLLRWAAENALFPIELRMALVALIALALVVVGYRQRQARPGFGRTLQGGGIAALYLVVFFSFRSYALLPAGLAFGLLVTIALASGVLAVVQNAQSLIIIGQIGGFMAPVLASSGGGSHVALFGYYTVLNLLILAIAWFKPWRALHLVGFAFTFGIATAWGALRYRPEAFSTTEPFLIVFFAIYTAIPVLYAVRRPEGRGGLLDASLVFGTPLSALLLQYALVRDTRFGMAYTTLALGVIYLVIARVLRKRAPEALRNLVDAFVALAVGFATLAVPYGLDNHNLTGATWALEGAGLYWAGTRQARTLSRVAGVGLVLLAYLALLTAGAGHPVALLPVANTRFIAGMLVVLASLFVARHAHAHRAEASSGEWPLLLQGFIVAALCLWLEISIFELEAHVGAWLLPGCIMALLGATALALELAGRRLDWMPARYPAALIVPLVPILLASWVLRYGSHPLSVPGTLGFGSCALATVVVLRGFGDAHPRLARVMHAVALWSLCALLSLEAWYLTRDFARLNRDWANDAAALCLALLVTFTLRLSARERWPFTRFREAYSEVGCGLLVALLMLWSLRTNLVSSGDPRPLPYVVLLNPLDLTQLIVLVVCLRWQRHVLRRGSGETSDLVQHLHVALGALAFLWFNALLARSVHHLAAVPFQAHALWASSALQVAVSISWSLLGLCATVLASRRARRGLWFLGATLLGVVVLKLFMVDLAALSTGIKIVTFLLVGLLLVLVGYFAPVPPATHPQEPA